MKVMLIRQRIIGSSMADAQAGLHTRHIEAALEYQHDDVNYLCDPEIYAGRGSTFRLHQDGAVRVASFGHVGWACT